MDLEKIFKRIIIVDFLVVFVALVYLLGLEIVSSTPVVEQTFSSSSGALEIFSLLLLFLYFVNLYLLFKFKSFGKKMYVPLLCLTYVSVFAYPIEDLELGNHVIFFLNTFGPILSGAIIAILYLTDVGKKFDQ